MKWSDWLEKWKLTNLKITAPFLELEWNPQDDDKTAAWDLYVELLTRSTTQSINDSFGCEKTALTSIHSLFSITREVLKTNGRGCVEFTKIAIIVLNQIIRPFTTKWHAYEQSGAFQDESMRTEFRKELTELQHNLTIYTNMLGDMAGVESELNLLTK